MHLICPGSYHVSPDQTVLQLCQSYVNKQGRARASPLCSSVRLVYAESGYSVALHLPSIQKNPADYLSRKCMSITNGLSKIPSSYKSYSSGTSHCRSLCYQHEQELPTVLLHWRDESGFPFGCIHEFLEEGPDI